YEPVQKRGRAQMPAAWPAPSRDRDQAGLAGLDPKNAQSPRNPEPSWGPRGPKPAPAPPRPQSRPNTMAGLAIMVAAVALTVMLPVAGLLASLAVITLLRAADQAQSKLAVRRSVRGPRASDLLVVLVMAPLSVARALLTEVLMA